MAPTSESAKVQKPRGNIRLIGGFTLILGVILAFLVFFSHRGLYRIYQLKQEGVRLEQENARLTEENTRLARTINRLQTDPEMIQDLIRRELNFIRKNEIIVQLPAEVKGREQIFTRPLEQPPVIKRDEAKGHAAEGPKKQVSRKPKPSN